MGMRGQRSGPGENGLENRISHAGQERWPSPAPSATLVSSPVVAIELP